MTQPSGPMWQGGAMPSSADLVAAFTAHLQHAAASSTTGLATALDEAGFPEQAALLGAYAAQGPHWRPPEAHLGSARRCWVGPSPPVDQLAGDLWFDPGEVVSSVLVPRPDFDALASSSKERLTPFTAWLSVRPVADWQLAGVLRLARSSGARPLQNGVLAAAYAGFFGKSLATAEDWSAMFSAYGAESIRELWGGEHLAELGGYVNEGLMARIALARILDGTVDDSDVDTDEAVVDEGEPLTLPFRTHVPTQLGLLPPDQSWDRTR